MNHKKSKCRESDTHLVHVLLFALFLFNLPYSDELQLVNFFPPPSPTRDTTSINFTHITVDSSSGNVYVGATNWLYQLTTNLSVEHAVRTGPVLDGPMCSPIDCSGVDEQSVRLSNNTNKVLVVDPSSRMLISCGSAHQGSCRRHSLTDVRQAEPLTGFPVAANDENSSTVAFVGLAKYYGVSYVLYVGASNSKLGPYRELVPAISSRSLEPGPRLFSIIEKSFQDTARVDISYHLRDYFIVKYIYGFQSGEHVYFATVQKKSHFRALEEWGHVTRLARVCSSDAGFHTYTEMTISCIGSDGTDYSLLQDATVVRVGSTLARNMGLGENDEVFIGTFATPQDHSLTPSGSSAVCMFSLADIERGFTENIHLCFNGSVSSRNMDYIAGSMNECPEPRKSQNIVNFCNEPLKLNGSVPLRTSPVVVFPEITVTAITTSTNRHQTFAFLGTSSGSLKQIHIMSPTTAEEMGEIPIDPGHPILEDISHDSSGKFIFVLSPYRVAKVRIDGRQEATTAQLLPKQVSSSNATHHGISSIPEYSVTPGVDDPPVHHIQRSQHNNRRDSQHVNGAISGIEISPIIVCLLSAAAVGVLMVIILIGVTSIRRKGSGSSSFSGNDMGNHRLFSSASDAQELKFPPPLITSNSKPLPLIPLTIDREAMFEKGFSSQIVNQRSSLSPPDQVNAIYSEINELNIDRREDDSVLLSSSTTTTATTDDHLLLHHSHPLINHHSSRQHLVNQLSRESGPIAGCEGLFSNTANSTSSPASGNRMATAYPPFITFNTIGRSRNTSNPYTFHDSMTRITKPVTSSSPSAVTAVTLSNKGASPQTYAVYTYDKLSRGGRGRDSKGSFTSSTSSPSPSTRDRFV